MMNLPDDPAVRELVLAARSAAIRIDADLFSLKQSLRGGDGAGGLRAFDRRSLSRDDFSWVDQEERRFKRLNSALAAFGAAVVNPAGQ